MSQTFMYVVVLYNVQNSLYCTHSVAPIHSIHNYLIVYLTLSVIKHYYPLSP